MSLQPPTFHSLRGVCLGLLVACAGCVAPTEAARVECRITSSRNNGSRRINGIAESLVDITETVCREATGEPQVIQVNEKIEAVATAIAVAIARVSVVCNGNGNADLVVSGTTNAMATAEAIGTATARIQASRGVCGLCEAEVDSFATSMETVTATAVARLVLESERLEFRNEPLNEEFVEEVMRTEAIDVMSQIVGEFRTSSIDGCSANFILNSTVDGQTAECDTSISAVGILTEIDATAVANLDVAAISCDGEESSVTANISVSEVAVAVAQAVTAADTFCTSRGDGDGPSPDLSQVMACALSSGSVEAIARARAASAANALAEVINTECGCELFTNFTIDEVENIMAESSSAAFSNVCLNGTAEVIGRDFAREVEERIAEAFAELLVTASAGDYAECDVFIDAVAEINPTSDDDPSR